MENFPSRALYLMAKPPAELAEQIWRLPRADKARPPGLLHITILPFVDLALFPPEFVPVLCDLMRDFAAPAFRVAFDRIVERRSIVLRSSEALSVRGGIKRAWWRSWKRGTFRSSESLRTRT